MVGKKVLFNSSMRKEIAKGLTVYKEAVCSTLGPYGNRVIIYDEKGEPTVTKDGVTVSKAYWTSDRVTNAALSIIKAASSKTNREAGDGTTTTTLLSCDLTTEGFKLVDRGFVANKVVRGMDKAKEAVLKELREHKRDALDEDTIYKVAMVASNQDTEIAQTVVDAFSGIGDYGVVTITDSFDDKTHLKVTTGLETKKGYASSIFKNDDEEDCFKAENPLIYVSHKAINNMDQIYEVIGYAISNDKPLVLIVPAIDDNLLALLTQNVQSGTLRNFCVVYNPGFNESQREEYSADYGMAFGCKVANKKELGPPPSDFQDEYLGTCENVKVTATSAVFTGLSDKPEFQEHVTTLTDKLKGFENDIEEGHSQYEKDKLKERIARLCGGVATIFVGGTTAVELIERKHRYEDAANAVRVALVKGVLPGGGIALYKIASKISKKKYNFEDEHEESGFRLVCSICSRPFYTVLEHMGYEQSDIADFVHALNKIPKQESSFFKGPDMSGKRKYTVDFFEKGILDPLVVVEQSLINSVSAAASLVSAGCVMVDDIPGSISVAANDPDIMEALKR